MIYKKIIWIVVFSLLVTLVGGADWSSEDILVDLRFEDGVGSILDSSPSGKWDATTVDSNQSTDGVIGNARAYDGSTDRDEFVYGTDDDWFTDLLICMWLRGEGSAGGTREFALETRETTNNARIEFMRQYSTADIPEPRIYDSASNQERTIATDTITEHSYSWVCTDYDTTNNRLSIWINATNVSSYTTNEALGDLSVDNLYLGSRFDDDNFYKGDIDEVLIINNTNGIGGPELLSAFNDYIGGNRPQAPGGGADTTPPTITFTYPDGTYNETYNNYNGSINFETNEYTECITYNNSWASNYTNGSIHFWYNTGYLNMSDGLHSVNFSCNDTSDNQANATIFWYVDTTFPNSISTFDNNNTNITLFGNYSFNFSDNIMLWSVNISINGNITHNVTNIGSTTYGFNGTINTTALNLTNGNEYGAYAVVCDAHTGEVLKQTWNEPVITSKSIDFDGLTLTSKDITQKITYFDKIDRKSFCFEYPEPKSSIEITIPEGLTYINDPHYKGWFVDDSRGRWVDFEGAHSVSVMGNKVTVTPDKPQSKYCFESVGELNCRTYNYTWFVTNRLEVIAHNFVNKSNITNFAIFNEGALVGNTTDGLLYVDGLDNNTYYNITIDAPGYELKSEQVFINDSISYHNFSLYTTNSISINIYDESDPTFPLMNGTDVTMVFTSAGGGFTNITNTGTFYIDNLNATAWSIQFSAINYSDRTYDVTVGNRTHQTLNAYLALAQNTIFTVTDYDSGEPLQNVTTVVYRIINGSWTTVETTETDITGRTQISFVSDVSYRFYLSKDNYTDLIFYLDPVLFDSYNIRMNKITTQNLYPDYDGVSILYAPQVFFNEFTNFTFLVNSPTGELTNYGFTAVYPGGNNTESGALAGGGELTAQFNITGAEFGDSIVLDYYYTSTVYGHRNFTAIFPISFDGGTNQTTMIANKDRTFGLGIFERLLFVVVFIFVTVGIATLIGRPVEGFAFGLFLYGLFVFIGFIPLWSVLISILVGLILISAKGGV